jgi:acetyl-CoA carboxylase biotin carboxyl carrier protein
MREKTIRKLVKLVEEADIESLTVRNWWTKVQIVKKGGGGGNGNPHESTIAIPRSSLKPTLPPMEAAPNFQVALQPQPQPVSASTAPAPASGKEIKSPMVGMFYTSPEPGAPPFVDIGARVKKGQTVCIIEAMKLMNEIESEFDGIVKARLVENAQPVEFGQTLFVIEPV